jgi:uncharacterized membrane protein YqjE
MMDGDNHGSHGLAGLLGRIGRLALGGVQTRIELLAVEWQEERLRFAGLLFRALALLFLGVMGALLLTATVIFLFPERSRVYVAAVLGVLYLCGALIAWLSLKSSLHREPFAASVDQMKKDRLWLESQK